MRYNPSILLLFIAFTACAADNGNSMPESPGPILDYPPLPSKIRVIDEDSTPGQCADDQGTALCAVETFIACWINTPAHDCGNRPVTVIRDMAAWETLGHADSIEYSIISLHEFSSGDIDKKRPRAHRFPAGSVEIILKQRLTPGGQGPPKWNTGYYILAQDNSDWRIISYFSAPWPDPEITARRWMSQGESSSNCIGDTSDPICSVETLIACWLRRDGALCRRVIDCDEGKSAAALCRLPGNRVLRPNPALPWPRNSLEYYITVARKSLRADFVPPGVPLMEVWVEQFHLGPEGDQYRLVPENDVSGFLPAPGPGYWVAFLNGQWRIIGWGGELDG